MMKIIHNAITGETLYEEVEDKLIEDQPTVDEQSTLEQRVEIIEHNQDEIATILADVVGVTL